MDGYKPTYGHNSYGYQNPMYGAYQKHGYGNSYGYKKPYGTKYDSSHVDNTIKKVGEYADAQEDYKKQSLNIKYSYDAVPTEYDYVEKYGWGRPTTIGSLYNGYGYGNQYPQQYGYGHQPRTDTKGHPTDTRNLVIVKSPTVTNPSTEKSQRRTKIGKNRKKRPMKMAIGRTTLTKIGKNKNIAKIKKSY